MEHPIIDTFVLGARKMSLLLPEAEEVVRCRVPQVPRNWGPEKPRTPCAEHVCPTAGGSPAASIWLNPSRSMCRLRATINLERARNGYSNEPRLWRRLSPAKDAQRDRKWHDQPRQQNCHRRCHLAQRQPLQHIAAQ